MTRIFLFLFALGLIIGAPSLRAQAPRLISFQGLLADAAGRPLADGAHLITVRLYDRANGGMAAFEESTTVALERGVFAIAIGSTEGGIPTTVSLDRELFVGISVDGGVELLPRTPLMAVPLALHAQASRFADSATSATRADNATRADSATSATRADNATRAESATSATRSDSAGRAAVADVALSLSSTASGVVRSVNGRAGALRVVGDGGLSVRQAGDTLALRALPLLHVHKASSSAIELIDSATLPGGGSPLLRLDLRDSSSTRLGLKITSSAKGASALEASTSGGGSAAFFSKSNDRATGTGGTYIGPVIVAESRVGSGVTAAEFNALDTGNTKPAVDIQHRGRGVGLQVDASGANLATFRRRRVTGPGSSSTSTVVRFDSTGKGFFDGGTQNGGADIAEAFDVEGDLTAYSPGDVLVISTSRHRRVALSQSPYSTLVAGVYATKPGVLLTESMNGESLEQMVPMGVVGVIPTKVSSENGAIKIGDLIVTSSTPGHAMKGDPAVAAATPGCVIGKALEAFDGSGRGVIIVLVK